MDDIGLSREDAETIQFLLYNVCSLGYFPEELDQPSDPDGFMEKLFSIRTRLETQLYPL